MKEVRPLYVYNADGSIWDTIKAVTVGGTFYPFYGNGYGLVRDIDGNIIFCSGSVLYRVNYQTGEGMNRAAPNMGSLCSPAVDAAGNIYVAPVLPANPIQIYNPDFSFNTNAIDTIVAFGRWITVSADGNTIYVPRFTEYNMRVYNRASEFDPFELQDTILQGIVCESGAWDPITGNLWLSTGSHFTGGGLPTGQFAGRQQRWLSFDPTTWAVEDSIEWNMWEAGNENERPRGIAFSNDGSAAYCVVFGTGTITTTGAALPPMQKFSRPVDVKPDPNVVVSDYTLAQNYPNPFNPTTDIKFTVAKEGFVTLKVYDILGKEVAVLVNEHMQSGGYTADFNASELASGTYIYTLSVNGVSISKKMMLLK
jgi:hypothetical protein